MNTKGMGSVSLLIATLIATASYSATTIDIGDGIGHRSGEVWAPVILAADTDIAGVNMLIEYDPDFLTFDTVLPQQPPLGGEHLILWNSPEAGKVNIAAYAPGAPSVLRERSGTLLYLVFRIKRDAPEDVTSTEITFAAEVAGSPSLPGSGLSDSFGNSIAHTATSGSVEIEAAATDWQEYR